MHPDPIQRRDFLRRGAALAAAATFGTTQLVSQAQEPQQKLPLGGHGPAPAAISASEALERLLAGNRRFVAGASRHLHTDRKWRQEIAEAQHPFATVIGCADSRVPPELLFDQGFGDLFVVRIAGQAVDDNLLGSFQYAGLHLHTPLCMVLGHENCGAVKAALAARAGLIDEPVQLTALVKDIKPALEGLPTDKPIDDLMHEAVERNVRHAVYRVMRASGAGVLGRMSEAIVGAVYDLKTGRVRLLA
jgi:carbonic anhydrase